MYVFIFIYICFIVCLHWPQRTKESMSNIPGLVGFAVGLVDFTLCLPDRQVKVLGKTFFRKFGQAKKFATARVPPST